MGWIIAAVVVVGLVALQVYLSRDEWQDELEEMREQQADRSRRGDRPRSDRPGDGRRG